MEEETVRNENGGELVCGVCKKKFRDPEKLSLHMRFHSLFGNFKKTPAAHESNSEEVTNEGHGTALAPAVSPKPRSRASQSILLVEKPFRCTKCGVNFSSMRNKIQHDLLHAKKTSGFEQRGAYTTELNCGICKKRCRTESGLQKHFETEHTNLHEDQSMTCKTCLKKFRNKTALESHMQTGHTSDQNSKSTSEARHDIEAPIKKSSWVNFESVVVASKTNGKSLQMYKCKLCDALCYTIRSIKMHLKRHKGQKSVSAKCEECGRVFAEETSLKRHLTVIHKKKNAGMVHNASASNDITNKDIKAISKKLQSNGCDESTVTSKDSAANDELFRCEACSLAFPTAIKMRKHLKEKHSTKSAYRFQLMIKGFRKYKLGYNANTGATRFGYQCVYCKKRTNYMAKMISHVKIEHSSPVKDAQVVSDVNVVSNENVPTEIIKDERTEEPAVTDRHEHSFEHTNPKDSEKKKNGGQFGKKKVNRRTRFGTKKLKPKASSDDPCHCLDCGVVLKTEWALEHHYKTKHSGPNYQIVPKYSVVKGKYNLFLKCLICGKICRSKGNLKHHLREHEKNVAKEGNSLPVAEFGIDGALFGTSKLSAKKRKSAAKRSGSCIYHCRACGKSFPRLFSYTEHTCIPNVGGEKKENGVIDEQTEKEEVVTPAGESDTFVFTKLKVEGSSELGKNTGKVLSGINRKRKLSGRDNELANPGSVRRGETEIESENKELTSAQFRGKSGRKGSITFRRSPYCTQEGTRNDDEYGGKTPLRMQKDEKTPSRKFQCRFCKRPFQNEKQLSKHEILHTNANLVACSNCGMSFTALHKLRYHSMRCMQNREDKKHRPSGLDAIGTPLIGDESFNGRVNGNTYPSYARKSEYTVFDPANRPDEFDLNDNIVYNGMPASDVMVKPVENSTKSPLDDIVIADVRSCNPAFSGEKQIAMRDARNSETAGNMNPRGVLTSGDVGPGYYLDPAQGAYGAVDGIAPSPFSILPPDVCQQGMYTPGTVFLVPYFVPAHETFSNGTLLTGVTAPKPGSLPQGSFQIDPNDFKARISPCADSRFYAPMQDWNFQNHALPVDANAESNDKINLSMNLDELPNKCKAGKHAYDCHVCDETFSTFGGFVKHRESHRR